MDANPKFMRGEEKSRESASNKSGRCTGKSGEVTRESS